MVNAENGARIKAFGGSSSSTSTSGGGNGYATNITFQDFKCDAVTLPIVIDQCYETSDSTCASYPSLVLINDIHYINVTGTGTKSKEVVSLVCSDVCDDITATGTDLVGTSGSSEYYCTNIESTADLDFPCSPDGTVVSASSSSTTKTTKTSTTKTSTTKTTTTKTTTVCVSREIYSPFQHLETNADFQICRVLQKRQKQRQAPLKRQLHRPRRRVQARSRFVSFCYPQCLSGAPIRES